MQHSRDPLLLSVYVTKNKVNAKKFQMGSLRVKYYKLLNKYHSYLKGGDKFQINPKN